MPLYDFTCRVCRHDFEALVRNAQPVACPACKSEDVERHLSTFAVSTDESRASAAKASRKQQMKGRREELAAEEHARQHHDD